MEKSPGYEVISENLYSKLEFVRPEFFFPTWGKNFFGFVSSLIMLEYVLKRP